MTYCETWEQFATAAQNLQAKKPQKCRFVVKYDHKEGKMVLKITDDKVCHKYATDQLQDVRRLEKLTATLMRTITSAHP
uniref:Signal recognition particle 9 kDa protein n=1 Tax=Steinernema glaseri TaxID=37863 RepID=A0A1I7ZZW2_9BILA